MAERFSTSERRKMRNPFLQSIRFIILNFKIMRIVAGGHGGTRDKNYLTKTSKE